MACNQACCYCKCYKESSSKWSKNKCHSCNHRKQDHKPIQQSNNNNVTRVRSMTTPVITQNHPNFAVGDKLDVLYDDEWYGAEIINITKQQIEITYNEWDEFSNEWINKSSKRLKKKNNIKKTNMTVIWENKFTEEKQVQYTSNNMDITANTNGKPRSSSVSDLRQKFINSTTSNNTKHAKPVKKITNSLSTGDCSLCAACNVSNIITLTKCQHKLCKECMNNYIKITSTDKLNIKCPFCSIPLDRYRDVKPALSHQEFYDIYLRPNLKKCLSANCNNTIKLIGTGAARLDCSKCNKSWCVNCNVAWHNNMDCDAYKQTEEYIVSEQQFNQFLNENQEFIKKCPNCNVDIEKNMGCNHMHCVSCNIHFCWKCRFAADNSNTIYSHMASCC